MVNDSFGSPGKPENVKRKINEDQKRKMRIEQLRNEENRIEQSIQKNPFYTSHSSFPEAVRTTEE